MKPKNNIFSILVYLFFFGCLLPAALFAYRHPAYNFDMLGYMALVLKMDTGRSIDEVHHAVYENARKELPAEEYNKLTETPAFRKKFETNAREFEKLLPIYVVKPLYVRICWLFYKAGFSLPLATVIPSILAFLATGLFLFYWLKKHLAIPVAFLAGLLIMYSLFTISVARLSTPDALSALFLFVACYFILERRNIYLLFVFLLLAVFARLDNVITSFFIISFLAFGGKWSRISRWQYASMLLILCLAWLVIVLSLRQFGWNLFFYGQYARQIDFSSDFDQAVTLSSYLQLAYSRFITMIVSYHFCFFIFLVLLIVSVPPVPLRKLGLDQLLALLLVAIMIFRFFLLPDLSDRFYFGFYLVIIMLLVRKISTPTIIPAHAHR